MELMNQLFGFSRGRYPLDRDALQDVFVEGLESLGYNSHGIPRIQDEDLIPAHDDLFAVHSYWWGDEDAGGATRTLPRPDSQTSRSRRGASKCAGTSTPCATPTPTSTSRRMSGAPSSRSSPPNLCAAGSTRRLEALWKNRETLPS